MPVTSADRSGWGSGLMPLSGCAFHSTNSRSCSLQHIDQISQLFKRAGAVPGNTVDHLGQGCCLPAVSHHCCFTGKNRAIAGIPVQRGARDRFIYDNFTALSRSISWLFSGSILLCCKSIMCLWSWWQDIPWWQCSWRQQALQKQADRSASFSAVSCRVQATKRQNRVFQGQGARCPMYCYWLIIWSVRQVVYI